MFVLTGGEPLLRKDFTVVIKFISQTGIRFKIVYFGSETSDESNELCWDLIAECGNTSLNHLESFAFICLPKWTRFKLLCCCSSLPDFLSQGDAVFSRFDLVRDFL